MSGERRGREFPPSFVRPWLLPLMNARQGKGLREERVKDLHCSACHESINDQLDSCVFDDDDELVHIRCPLPPGDPVADGSIIVGLGATPAERGRSDPLWEMPDHGCATCGEPLAGATSSGSIVVETETGGSRYTVCEPCYLDEDELVGVF